MKRILIAVAFAVLLLSIDSAIRLVLVLHAPRLAPLPHLDEKLTFRLDGTDDHTGIMFNVQNNIRLTVGQPVVYTRTVWIYGNSGAFGMNVADADTMESRLQALLNETGYRWRVVNTATPGERISGELTRLRDSPVKRGDIVIFDDGVMDLVGNRCTDNRFAIMQLFCQISYDAFNANVNDLSRFEIVVQQVKVFANTHGVTLYHFIQPTPYPMFVRGASGIHLQVPDDMLSDAAHLTEDGERLEAHQIFDALTLI